MIEKKPDRYICLNMIVRNEAETIEACLESVKDVVDYYVIVDTGSEDNTIEVIKNKMNELGIEGEIHERTWRGFSPNRNEAYQLALGKSKYIFIIDADEDLRCENPEIFQNLTADAYVLNVVMGDMKWPRGVALVRGDSEQSDEWRFRGTIHETFSHSTGEYDDGGVLPGATIFCREAASGRSYNTDSHSKFMADAALLRKRLQDDPNCSRSCFYLAQSYRDAGEPELAVKYYLKRIDIGGSAIEEIYMAKIYASTIMWSLGDPKEDIQELLLDAHETFPTRVEALYWLSRLARDKNKPFQAYMFSKRGTELEAPDTGLFFEMAIHEYLIYDELSLVSQQIGRREDCLNAALKMAKGVLKYEKEIGPVRFHRERILGNTRWYLKKYTACGDEVDEWGFEQMIRALEQAAVT